MLVKFKGFFKRQLFKFRYMIFTLKSVSAFSEFLDSVGDIKIMSGVFKGMSYLKSSYGSAYYPKILGTYEKEISFLFSPERLKKFKCFMDIGCAEGYYLCGIAYLLKKCDPSFTYKIIGYDIDLNALNEARRILEENHIDGIKLKKDGFQEDLEDLMGPVLLICDIEGDEIAILDPAKTPALCKIHIIVEIHDKVGEDIVLNTIMNRFQTTHSIRTIKYCGRTLSDFPKIKFMRFDNDLKLELINEWREKGIVWLSMEPLN